MYFIAIVLDMLLNAGIKGSHKVEKSSEESSTSNQLPWVPDSTAEDSTAEDSTAELYLPTTLRRSFS